jgi:hypothetical protein
MNLSRLCAAIVVVLSLAMLPGCGGLGGSNYACDLRPTDSQCTDWRSLVGPAITQEGVCKTLNSLGSGGSWKPNEKCPAAGSVGGCQVNSGIGLQTNWFYAPRTEMDVRAECTSDGTTFVSP